MGVMATLCAVCGLPVNDDQYVGPGEEPVRLTAERAWLLDVIGIAYVGDGPRLEGAVDDQVLRTSDGREAFVCDGLGAGDYLTLHRRCWELGGRPETEERFARARETPGWAQAAAHHGQLFEFRACVAQDPWLLADPDTDAGALNRARILGMLEACATTAKAPAADAITALLATDAWTWSKTKTSHAAVRDGAKGCDPCGYEHWIEVEKPYLADDVGLPQPFMREAVTGFTLKLQRIIEADALGVLVAITHAGGRSRYTIYARDAEACRARIEGLAELHSPKPAEIEVTHDPDWSGF